MPEVLAFREDLGQDECMTSTEITYSHPSNSDWTAALEDGRSVLISRHGKHGFDAQILTVEQTEWMVTRDGCFPQGGQVRVGTFPALADAKTAVAAAI